MPGKTKQQLQDEFDEGLNRLWAYYKREGHCHVHREHKDDDGYFLGRFVKNTLSKYKNNYMSEENISRVEELPGWEWSPKSTNQNKKLRRLVRVLTDFQKEHGHQWVPVDMEVDGDNILKTIHYYRRRYHGKNPPISEVEALESIPGWSWESPETNNTYEEKWERKFQLLIKYAMINGNTFVPQLYEMEGERLGQWTERQRKLYLEEGILEHRIKRLEKLPQWKWVKPDRDDFFNEALVCLLKFFEEYGPKMPPLNLKTSYGTGLNEWIITQRKSFKLGNMPKGRVRRLESIPEWAWSSKELLWMNYFSQLKDFNSNFGHCDVPETYKVKGRALRGWLVKCRRKFVQQELSEKQMELLMNLDGWQCFLEKSQLYQKPSK